MKKLLSLILTLCYMGTLLCSCVKEPPVDVKEPKKDEWVSPREAINERFIYRGSRRYDVAERKSTILCPDPLCEHGDGCVMSITGEIQLITEKYIYMIGGNGFLSNKSYYRYDILENKVEKLFTAEGQCSYPFWVGDDVYFCASEYEYADTGELIGEAWHMYRVENEAGAPVKITAEPLPDAMHGYCYNEAQGKMVWYYSTASATIFLETDFDLTSFKQIERPKIERDGYYYAMGYNKAGENKGTLRFTYERTNAQTGETEVFCDDAETLRVVEDAEGKFKGVIWSNGSGVAQYKNFDADTEPRVWDFGDDYTVTGVFSEGGNPMQTVEWILAYLGEWEKDENGDFVLDDYGKRIIAKRHEVALNCYTGEYFFFKE